MQKVLQRSEFSNTGKLIVLAFTLLLFCISQQSQAQCPTIEKISEPTAKGDTYSISITLNLTQNIEDFSYHLFDTENQGYVYDEKQLDPGFYLNQEIKLAMTSSNQITFTGLPEGEFHLIISGKGCHSHVAEKPLKISQNSR